MKLLALCGFDLNKPPPSLGKGRWGGGRGARSGSGDVRRPWPLWRLSRATVPSRLCMDLNCKLFPTGPEQQAHVPRWTMPALNRELVIGVVSAGPEQQPLDQSAPPDPAASSRSQCSPPDPNNKLRIRAFPPNLHRKLQIKVPRRTSTASTGSECSPPDLTHKESPKI